MDINVASYCARFQCKKYNNLNLEAGADLGTLEGIDGSA